MRDLIDLRPSPAPPVSLSSQVLRLVLHQASHEDAVQNVLSGGGHDVASDDGVVTNTAIVDNHWF